VRVRGVEIPGRIVRTEASVQGHGLIWYPVPSRTYHDPCGEDVEYSTELMFAGEIPDGSVVMYPKGKNLWELKNGKLYGLTSKSSGWHLDSDRAVYVVNVDDPIIKPWVPETTGEPIYEMEFGWVDLECTDSSGANLLKFAK